MIADPLLTAFAAFVRTEPDAVRVVSPSASCTTGELDRLARAIAGRLASEHSAEPGSIAGLAAPNGAGFLAGLLALRHRGLAALLIDVRTPPGERRRVAAALGAALLVECAATWPRGAHEIAIERVHPEPLHVATTAAVIKLSSGTTGAPRGVATASEALLADEATLSTTMGVRPGDRLLTTVPLSHSYGLSSLALPALVRGAVLVVPDEHGPFASLHAALALGATVFPTVPALLAALCGLNEAPPLAPTLRLVLSAGALLAPQTAARFRERFGLSVHGFYGASECGGICYDAQGGAAERGSVGSPLPGVQVTLASGRVTVRSSAVATSYLPEEDWRLSGGRFVSDDLAEWSGDELCLIGRIGDTINVRGTKVNPREVEQVLVEHPQIDEAHVLGVPEPSGVGELVRAVVACAHGSLSSAQVVDWCRARLVPHKVPRSVVIVKQLPRTDRGKIDRALLREQNP